jgi:diadenosine tetraphosphate (Ap4A) HIT family hydrolase
MQLSAWPSDFFDRKAGVGCPQCEEGRPEENAHGVRYFEGITTDGYLQRRGPALGYSVVVFRGRHVGDPQSMTSGEHAAFWAEVSIVAKAIELAFDSAHLNFQLLGNADPHVHVHVVPRYNPDPAPCRPLPPEAWERSRELTTDELNAQMRRLREALAKIGA